MTGERAGRRCRRLLRVVAGVVLMTVLAGCSDQSLQDYLSGEKPVEDPLTDATVASAKRLEGVDLCSLLTRSEVVTAMGSEPLGPPERAPTGLCTWSFATSLPDIRDSVMVSSAGRLSGREIMIRGNSALLTPSGLGCTATVAVAEREPERVTTDALSVRYTNERQSTHQHCQQARDLARRAFDRLPPR